MKKKTDKKMFSSNTVTKKELRSLMCGLARSMGVNRVRFGHKALNIHGSYSQKTKTIFVLGKDPKKGMLQTFFHELAHHVVCSKGLWLAYHKNACTPKFSPLQKFQIENNVDRVAQGLWFKYVDTKAWGRYKFGYPKSMEKCIVEWIEDYFKQ